MWYEKYIGTPWVSKPCPPESFNCGELVRYILKQYAGIDTPIITANANSLRECIAAMRPSYFGLSPLSADAIPQQFDVVFMCQADREDHVGIAVDTTEGLLILHCCEGSGTVLETPFELLGNGFRKLKWYRHMEIK